MNDVSQLPVEKNSVVCKVCNQLKVKIEAGFYPGTKRNKKYVDESGKLWNGKKCPDCHKSIAKKVMQAYRLPDEK